MKKVNLIFKSIIIAIIISSCEKNDSVINQNTLIIDNSTERVVDLTPNIVRKPKTIVQQDDIYTADGTYMFDFEKDNLWEFELLAFKSDSGIYKSGVGLRSIPHNDRSTYICLDPLNEFDTINIATDWTFLSSTDLTMLVTDSDANNQWSEYKFLAIRQYFQNQDINKYYWVKLKIENSGTEYEIDSYYE